MTTNWNSYDAPHAHGAGRTDSNVRLASPAPHRQAGTTNLAPKTANPSMTAILKPISFTTPYLTPVWKAQKPKSSALIDVREARRRFFAEHGPGAPIRRRPLGTRIFRQALLPVEPVHWENF